MPSKEDVVGAMKPLLQAVSALDLTDPAAAAATLTKTAPMSELQPLRSLLLAAQEEGWLTPREANGVAFGRLAKPRETEENLSIDVVDMTGPGPGHTHPHGEVSLCFAVEGEDPRFMGEPEGWVVVPPGSHHVPTVTGGRMLIAYFLPDGAMVFDA